MNARMAVIKGIELKVNKAFAIEVLASAWINRRLASISKKPPAIPGNPVFLIFVRISKLMPTKPVIRSIMDRLRFDIMWFTSSSCSGVNGQQIFAGC